MCAGHQAGAGQQGRRASDQAQATSSVRQLPPIESFRQCVSLLDLKGTWAAPWDSAMTTCPRNPLSPRADSTAAGRGQMTLPAMQAPRLTPWPAPVAGCDGGARLLQEGQGLVDVVRLARSGPCRACLGGALRAGQVDQVQL